METLARCIAADQTVQILDLVGTVTVFDAISRPKFRREHRTNSPVD